MRFRGRPSSLFAVVAGIALIAPGWLFAQSGPPFEGEPFTERALSTQPYERSASSSQYSQQPAGRFTDARPITPSGRYADGDGDGSNRAGVSGPSTWKTLGTLAGVIALIVVGGRLWKKHGPRLTGGLPPEAIEVLGKRSIDSRQAIFLVRLGSRILVLGSTANGLQALSEVTDPVEVDYLAGLCRKNDGESSAAESFRSLFSGRSVVGGTEDSSAKVDQSRRREEPVIRAPASQLPSAAGRTHV